MTGAHTPSERMRRAMGTILALLVLLLGILMFFLARMIVPVGSPEQPVLPDGMRWMRSIYGWGKAETQQLYGPSDVAIGPDGTIWVTDPQRWQVLGFSPQGTYRGLIHRGPGQMMPQSIAVSEDNEIYIADYLNGQIRVFDPDNRELRKWTVPQPTEVDARDGKVAVGMVGAVALFEQDGTLIDWWGDRGGESDEVDIVRGVAIGEDGTIFISDTQNRRLKAYEPDGTLVWVYPTPKEAKRLRESERSVTGERGPYDLPAGMAFDRAGRLIVADPFRFEMVAVDPKTGKVVARFGKFGSADGEFTYPTSISYDRRRDYFAVADTGNNRVQIVRLPDSGGIAPVAAAWRLTDQPLWILIVPILLVILGIVVQRTADRRRAARESANGAPVGSQDASSPAETGDETLL